jgi:hypothetical protein
MWPESGLRGVRSAAEIRLFRCDYLLEVSVPPQPSERRKVPEPLQAPRGREPGREHGCAFPRQVLPESCFCSSPNGGQRAQGRPGAGGTRWSVRDKSAHGVDRWGGRSPGLPCADGFNGVLRALPGERCTIAPVAPPMADARARSGRHITAGLDAQTPGVRTTRLLRPRTVPPKSSRACVCSPPMSDKPALQRRVVRVAGGLTVARPVVTPPAPSLPRPPPPGPHVVTVANAPLAGPGLQVYAINPKFGKVKCFCAEGLTGCFARRAAVDAAFPLKLAVRAI